MIKPLNHCRPRILLLLSLLAAPAAHGAFRYADAVTTTGGQFGATYPPSNLTNNGFTSPTNTIDTTVTYAASGNNYASLNGTTVNFNLTFNFNNAVDLSAMYVWNYIYRTSTGAGNGTPGVNAYTLTFYSGTDGAGSVIGSFSGNLTMAVFNTVTSAQTVNFGTTNLAVRSVVMHISSNFGGSFTGMSELAFESPSSGPPSGIISFSASTNFVAHGKTVTWNWEVGAVSSLVIDHGVGSVLGQTTNGMGSIVLAPTNGYVTYTLTADGVYSNSVSLIGLPAREKLHIYLLMGQSNMEGHGTYFDPVLDAPQPRVLQFGSRDGMESIFVQAQHPLTSLSVGSTEIGMGLEFAKTMLASNADPDVVICLINHALGSTAIQWWAPGAITTKGATHHLYDEAMQRAFAVTNYGVIKGVLWHQGEYNSNTGNSNPLPEPELYAQRVQALVDNLRRDLSLPGLPFICGKFVPQWTNSLGQVFVSPNLQARAIVEAALDDLPNHRFNTGCADNAGLIGREDQTVHFDAGSQRELGRRYAAKMLALYSAMSGPPMLSFNMGVNQMFLNWPSNYTGWYLQAQTNSNALG
ncbi:MAG: sialate O-acetylesterase, partial [Verrucomicrobiota bacterium]